MTTSTASATPLPVALPVDAAVTVQTMERAEPNRPDQKTTTLPTDQPNSRLQPGTLNPANPGNPRAENRDNGLLCCYCCGFLADCCTEDITTVGIGDTNGDGDVDGVVVTSQSLCARMFGWGVGRQTTIGEEGYHHQNEGWCCGWTLGINGDGVNADGDIHAPQQGDIEDPTCFGPCFESMGDCITSTPGVIWGGVQSAGECVGNTCTSCCEGFSSMAESVGDCCCCDLVV